MRYLVKARIRPEQQEALLRAIESRRLGWGSVAGDEYLHDMEHARRLDDGTICWLETCFCPTPLQEELPYWEEYFEILRIKNAHARSRCRDLNGVEPWACCDCDCTRVLEERMSSWGVGYLQWQRDAACRTEGQDTA